MNYFFSRVRLDRNPRDVELLMKLSRHGAAYRDHALVWRLFPGDALPRDFLFRSEQDERGRLCHYYVVSRRSPEPEPGLLDVETKPYRPQFAAGEWLRFSLRANPTISRPVEGRRSRRHDVLMDAKKQAAESERGEAMEAAARQWLLARAPGWGLTVRGETVATAGYTQHRLEHRGRRIQFSSLDYSGVAQVNEPERLMEVLRSGVGHARGFGCGLLLVRRAC